MTLSLDIYISRERVWVWTNLTIYCYLIINRLPDEVWVLIFDYTELKDLRKVACVCMSWVPAREDRLPDARKDGGCSL